eukprot:SM000153S01577  [mRNA]  locus=s153:83104:88118:+ [translate_table: standard]
MAAGWRRRRQPPEPPLFLHLAVLTALAAAAAGQPFNTLDGGRPLVIARGGASILYPDMSVAAYDAALAGGAGFVTCGVLLTRNGAAICRPAVSLQNTTNVGLIKQLRHTFTTYDVEGVAVKDQFSVDLTLKQVKQLRVAQVNQLDRTTAWNYQYPVVRLDQAWRLVRHHPSAGLYLELLAPSFFAAHNLSVTAVVTAFLAANGLSTASDPVIVASSDVSTLQALRKVTGVRLVLTVPAINATEFSTKRPYSYYLDPKRGLATVAAFASGLAVPKTAVQPQTGPDGRSPGQQTTVVADAHAANLTLFIANLANDDEHLLWLYAGDPINEYTFFATDPVAAADGFITDSPATAVETLDCYPASYNISSTQGRQAWSCVPELLMKCFTDAYLKNADCELALALERAWRQTSWTVWWCCLAGLPTTRPLIIGDASGIYPAQTGMSYTEAVNEGVDVLLCQVQISSDSVLYCRENVDLTYSTNILTQFPDLKTQSYPTVEEGSPGIFTFDLPSAIVDNLTAVQSSSDRNMAYDFANSPLRLTDFLGFILDPRNGAGRPVGFLLEPQYATFVASRNLSMVDALLSVLAANNLTQSTLVSIFSLEQTILKELKGKVAAKLLQRIDDIMPDYSTPNNYTSDYYQSPAGLKAISTYATGIVVYKNLIVDYDLSNSTSPDFYFLRRAKTSTIAGAKALGLSVYAYTFRNDALVLPFDYQFDPTWELQLFYNDLGLDGLVTEFPLTAAGYFSNRCYGKSKNSSQPSNFTQIVPGMILATIPGQTVLSPPPPSVTAPAAAPAQAPSPSPTGSSVPPPTSPPPSIAPSASPPASPPAPPPASKAGNMQASITAVGALSYFTAALLMM